MIDNPALGIDPADPRARVHTVQVDTGQGGGTVRINGTFWPACYVGVAKVLGNALACSRSGSCRASSIAPTGGGVAGVYNFCWC